MNTRSALDLSDYGRGIADSWQLGMLDGLGHQMSVGRCARCGDSRDAIQERIAGGTTDQLLLGEFRCAGSSWSSATL